MDGGVKVGVSCSEGRDLRKGRVADGGFGGWDEL